MDNFAMPRLNRFRASVAACLSVAAWALLNAGCAQNKVLAQWHDPQFANHPLHGAKVLVVCDTNEVAIERVCEEQMSARLSAAGAVPVTPPPSEKLSLGLGPTHPKVLEAAHQAGARAVLFSGVAPDVTEVTPGPTIGFGFGGFGGTGGYSSGAVGAGVGVSTPVGSPRVDTAYAANMALVDADSGRMMWTGKVRAEGRQDINQQMATIAANGIESAEHAGIF